MTTIQLSHTIPRAKVKPRESSRRGKRAGENESLRGRYCFLRQRPHRAGEFENAALFLRLGLPSTLIRHDNGAFRKGSSNPRNLKTPAFRFRVDGKLFENGAL